VVVKQQMTNSPTASRIADLLESEFPETAHVVAREVLDLLSERQSQRKERLVRARVLAVTMQVAECYGLTRGDLLGRSSVHCTARVRRLAWALAYYRANCSHGAIAEVFGRSYETVAQGARQTAGTDEYQALASAHPLTLQLGWIGV
jgi:chromosomal replication initiation ATPase DnaA